MVGAQASAGREAAGTRVARGRRGDSVGLCRLLPAASQPGSGSDARACDDWLRRVAARRGAATGVSADVALELVAGVNQLLALSVAPVCDRAIDQPLRAALSGDPGPG